MNDLGGPQNPNSPDANAQTPNSGGLDQTSQSVLSSTPTGSAVPFNNSTAMPAPTITPFTPQVTAPLSDAAAPSPLTDILSASPQAPSEPAVVQEIKDQPVMATPAPVFKPEPTPVTAEDERSASAIVDSMIHNTESHPATPTASAEASATPIASEAVSVEEATSPVTSEAISVAAAPTSVVPEPSAPESLNTGITSKITEQPSVSTQAAAGTSSVISDSIAFKDSAQATTQAIPVVGEEVKKEVL